MTNPCKDCISRKTGCHGSCEKYKNWKVEWDLFRENERKRKEQEFIGWRKRK